MEPKEALRLALLRYAGAIGPGEGGIHNSTSTAGEYESMAR